MAALAWEVVRTVTQPLATAAFAVVVGLSTGLLLHRSTTRDIACLRSQMRALRSDAATTFAMQQLWILDREKFDRMFPEEDGPNGVG